MYECDNGFGLNPGPVTRMCEGDDSSVVGTFDGSPPTCEGMSFCLTQNARVFL